MTPTQIAQTKPIYRAELLNLVEQLLTTESDEASSTERQSGISDRQFQIALVTRLRALRDRMAGAIKVDASATATHTRLFVYDVDNGTLERVTVGIADSGGAGFKLLRIPN